MAIKLIKACKDLNIGMATAVEFLLHKGIRVESSPNARITDELFQLLAQAFNKGTAVKQETERDSSMRIIQSNNTKDMNTHIADTTWSDEQIIDQLLTNWQISELILIAEYDGNQLVKVKTKNKRVQYPNGQKVFFKVKKIWNLNLIIGQKYVFKCRLADRTFRESINNMYVLNIIPSSIHEIENLNNNTMQNNPTSELSLETQKEVIKDLSLTRNEIIGKLVLDNEKLYFNDLRNPVFSKLIDKDNINKKLQIEIKSNGWKTTLKINYYYQFKCIVVSTNPLVFDIDYRKEPILLLPRSIIEKLYERKNPDNYDARKSTCQQLKMLETQLTGSDPEIFIYELLQNANDYPIEDLNGKKHPVDVEFHILKNFILFEHTGQYFTPSNIAALCDINAEEKAEKKDAIGYKGIGFKTIFHSSNYVYLKTGEYQFCFDESLSKTRTYVPWQIVPIWKDNNEINNEVNEVFNRTDDTLYRVKFAIQLREPELLSDIEIPNNYISLFNDVFQTERVILFITNLRNVNIYFDDLGIQPISRTKDSNKWIIRDVDVLCDNVDPVITDNINLALSGNDNSGLSEEQIKRKKFLLQTGYDRIPIKYINFKRSSVKFACYRIEKKILPVIGSDNHIYCYLPIKGADWGFPFLMNTDMIPDGPRKHLEDIEINHEIAKIAGRQFYEWIKDLLSSDYEKDGIFSLIPDFEKCKTNRDDVTIKFIEEFRDEFEKLIKSGSSDISSDAAVV